MKQDWTLEHTKFGKEDNKYFSTEGFLNPTLAAISTSRCKVSRNERTRKKGAHNERVLQIEHVTFTPLFFSIYRSVGVGWGGGEMT